ncbi:MAG: cobalamin-binding protein [Salinisphaera sp.]|jgi:iron complex transport system substrate-binding protein|nr:cobalamin-binding protein [Salinisphaera sp.]
MPERTRHLAVCVLALIVAFAGLPALAHGVSVTDFQDHRITLAHPAQRIVALAPHLVENLYSAGAGKRIVGAEADSDYPPAARAIPSIGGYHSMSVEAIVAQRPDLVVAWASGGTADLVARLRGLGIPVYVDAPRHLDDIARAIEDFGQLAGTSQLADRAASVFRQHIAKLRAQYASRRPVSLFFEVWHQPLQTLSDHGLIGDVIRICGGRNIFADAPGLAPRVSMESVLARNPEAIVASSTTVDADRRAQAWSQWPGLRAVRQHHLLSVPADLISRPTVRIEQGAADLCHQLNMVRKADDRIRPKINVNERE